MTKYITNKKLHIHLKSSTNTLHLQKQSLKKIRPLRYSTKEYLLSLIKWAVYVTHSNYGIQLLFSRQCYHMSVCSNKLISNCIIQKQLSEHIKSVASMIMSLRKVVNRTFRANFDLSQFEHLYSKYFPFFFHPIHHTTWRKARV